MTTINLAIFLTVLSLFSFLKPIRCACVATTTTNVRNCVDNVNCIQGDIWDAIECKCVKNDTQVQFCVDNVFCIFGHTWDPIQCKCIPLTASTPIHSCRIRYNCIFGKVWNQDLCSCV